MAYITPDTDIYFLENVPLDNTYTNTLYFSSKSAQLKYFKSMVKTSVDNYTYQRATSGELKVGIATARLYTCNYMIFQNHAYSDKWFYAFILNVEYVNDNTTLVTYEIDEIQTWFFDFTITGWVAREHTSTDNIGDNILPEPVDCGEYVFHSYIPITGTGSATTDKSYCVAVYVDNDGENASYLPPFVTGCKMRIFDIDTAAGMKALNALVDAYIASPDSIVGMYMIPEAAMPVSYDFGSVGYFDVTDRAPYRGKNVQFGAITRQADIDGYKPKNAKLYTYPYNYYHVDNSNGESLKLRYEFFKGNKPQLRVEGVTLSPATIICRPQNYKNVEWNEITKDQTLNTESLTLSNFPQASWNTDTFKAWIAQNSVPTAAKLATDLVGMVVNPAGGVANAFSDIASTVSQGYSASIAADVCRGSTNNGNVNYAVGKMGFYHGRCTITKDYAKMIDQFFDRFGYNVSRTGTPLTHSRPHWNYVQMKNCDLTGSVPANAATVIISAHNAGITYWRKGSEVGNYTLDNSV